MYYNVGAYVNFPEGYVFISTVLSGVLQGCPLSGLLFVISIDPFLRKMKADIDIQARDRARACAGDIGAVIREGPP
eukprot:4539119-Lingulodinium_polyedra.AAC.1